MLERDFRAALKANPDITDSEILQMFRANLSEYQKAVGESDSFSIFNPYYKTKEVRVKPFIEEGTEESELLLNAFRTGRNQKQKLELLNTGIFASNRAKVASKGRTIYTTDKTKPLTCTLCRKDDIKWGAKICSGCRAEITYTVKKSTDGQEWLIIVLGFLFMIPLMLVFFAVLWVLSLFGVLWIISDGVTNLIAWLICGLAFVPAFWIHHKGTESQTMYVSTKVEFHRPGATAGVILGPPSD